MKIKFETIVRNPEKFIAEHFPDESIRVKYDEYSVFVTSFFKGNVHPYYEGDYSLWITPDNRIHLSDEDYLFVMDVTDLIYERVSSSGSFLSTLNKERHFAHHTTELSDELMDAAYEELFLEMLDEGVILGRSAFNVWMQTLVVYEDDYIDEEGDCYYDDDDYYEEVDW